MSYEWQAHLFQLFSSYRAKCSALGNTRYQEMCLRPPGGMFVKRHGRVSRWGPVMLNKETDKKHNPVVTFSWGALPFNESQFNRNTQRSVCLDRPAWWAISCSTSATHWHRQQHPDVHRLLSRTSDIRIFTLKLTLICRFFCLIPVFFCFVLLKAQISRKQQIMFLFWVHPEDVINLF